MPSTTTPAREDEFQVRTSARKSFNTCEWAWERGYVDELKPTTTKPAFRFGTLVHASLEKFYRPGLKRGPHPAKTFRRLYNADAEENSHFGVYDDEEWLNAGDLGVAMLRAYVETYGKDTRYKVVATEQPFRQPVYETVLVRPRRGGKKVRQRRYRFTYVGVLDGIWLDTHREPAELLLTDHKTAKQVSTLINQLALDMQSTAYWTWGVDWLYENGLLKPKQKLNGLLYNILRKGMPDDRKKDDQGRALNLDGTVSKKQPQALFERFPSYRAEAEREFARKVALADYKEMMEVINGERMARKMYPSGPFGCNGCQYRDICELHETGSDWEAMRDATMQTWDPYGEHEIYEGR